MTMNLQRTIAKRAMQMVLVAMCLFVTVAQAEYRDWIGEEEKANSRWIPQPKYLLVDTDAERDTFNSPATSKQEVTRFYVSPRIGVGWDNYIYHPYLLTYSALFEPGYTWRRTMVNNVPDDSNELTLNGKVNAEVLSQKPYATTFNFSSGHDEVQYGFFNLASVDSESWGIATGYRDGPVPIRLAFHESSEESDELFQRTISNQRVLDLTAHSERKDHNFTFFTYQYSQYDRTVETIDGHNRTIANDSANHRVDVQDTERFDRSILRTSVRFDSRESNQSPSVNDFSGTANYDLDLTDRLHNYDQVTYSQYSGEGFDSKDLYGSAGLRHQLYESLTSGIDVHGTWADSGAGSAGTDSTSAGVTVSEDYSKRIGSWGRLSISDNASFNFNHQNTSGGILVIANETHVIPANNIIRLSHPRALVVVSVTDSNNVPLEATDYTVIHSEPWQIQIDPFGPSHIQAGASVQVTYTIQNDPTASSTSFSDAVQVRLSFWNEMASIYARYSFADNHSSSPDIIIDNEDVFQAGANFAWKRLVLNADYTDQHSTFFTLQSFDLSETYSMDTSDNSTLSINLSQQWDVNASTSGLAVTQMKQHSTFYNFMLSYDWRPLQSLSWKNEIGYQKQTGLNLDENLIVARSYLNWLVGKIQMSAGYEYENVDYLHDSKLRNYVFFKLRRNF